MPCCSPNMNVILKTSVRLVMKPQAAYSGACNARVIVMRAASRPFFSIYLFSVKQSISLKHNSRVLRLKALAACQTSPILFKAFCTCCVSLPHSSAAAAPRCVHMSALLAFQLLPRAFHSHAAVSVPFRSTPPFFGSFSSPYLRLGTLPIWIFVSLNSIEALSRRRRWRGANALLQTAQPEKKSEREF